MDSQLRRPGQQGTQKQRPVSESKAGMSVRCLRGVS